MQWYRQGKGGSIRRFMEHMNPRSSRLVALNKPTEVEKGQWYFQRYIKELPKKVNWLEMAFTTIFLAFKTTFM